MLYNLLRYLERKIFNHPPRECSSNIEPEITDYEDYKEKRKLCLAWFAGHLTVKKNPTDENIYFRSFTHPGDLGDRLTDYEWKHGITWNTFNDESAKVISEKHDENIYIDIWDQFIRDLGYAIKRYNDKRR